MSFSENRLPHGTPKNPIKSNLIIIFHVNMVMFGIHRGTLHSVREPQQLLWILESSCPVDAEAVA